MATTSVKRDKFKAREYTLSKSIEVDDVMDSNRSLLTNGSNNNNSAISGRTYPSYSRLNKFNFATNLGRIKEKSELEGTVLNDNKDWQTEKVMPTDVFDRSMSGSSESSSLISSPRSPQSPRSFSTESLEETSTRMTRMMPSQDPDVMAVSRGSPRSRRSGFAFRFGDAEVPANAFLNTENDHKVPKMLTVTEMMMKIHAENKHHGGSKGGLSAPDKTTMTSRRQSETLTKQEDRDRMKSVTTAERFSLIGLRKVTSSEIEEDLHFLHCDCDESLNLSLYEKTALLWYEKEGRFAAGLLLGIVLCLVFRFILAISSLALER